MAGKIPRRKYRSHDEDVRPIVELVVNAIEALDNDALQAVIDTPSKLSNTNCWWASYGLAPALADIADSVMRDRRWTAKRGFVAWLVGKRPAWAGPWRIERLEHVDRWVRPIHRWDAWNYPTLLTATIKDDWHVIGPMVEKGA